MTLHIIFSSGQLIRVLITYILGLNLASLHIVQNINKSDIAVYTNQNLLTKTKRILKSYIYAIRKVSP